MVEATHSSEALYGIGRALGRGARLWAGNIIVSDAETIDTGLDTLEAVTATPVEATAPTTTLRIVEVQSVSGGTITFIARQCVLTTAADADRDLDPSTDTVAYVIVAGAIR